MPDGNREMDHVTAPLTLRHKVRFVTATSAEKSKRNLCITST